MPACDGADISDRDGKPSIDDFLPAVPEPTGGPQSTWAGEIDSEAELIAGPAASGREGDFYLRNSRGRFVVQAPVRTLGVVPQGGNLVDAVPLAGDGGDLAPDHFGELSMNYRLGRTCEHTEIEVVRDGGGGGVAAIRARGHADVNDFVNIRGAGLLPLQNSLIPEFPDAVECATTYLLAPDSDVLEVRFTLWNGGETPVEGPFALLNDTGGDIDVWSPEQGFSGKATVASVIGAAEAAPTPYVVYQAPGVAYGVIPVHPGGEGKNASVNILGVSLIAYGVEGFLDVLDQKKNRYFSMAAGQGVTHGVDIVVGEDAADVAAAYAASLGRSTSSVRGSVRFEERAEPAVGARVGVYRDVDGSGDIGPNDVVTTYADVAGDGSFEMALEPGAYLLSAGIDKVARSETLALTVGPEPVDDLALALPNPVVYSYRIVDDAAAGAMIPARLVVLGTSPIAADPRLFSRFDTGLPHVLEVITAVRGTSTDVGDGADPPLVLAPGGDYRVFALRGTEWDAGSLRLRPQRGDDPGELVFSLRRVVDTAGYLATEYHVHGIGSPDSPVQEPARVKSAVADGVELFAMSDHDFVSDLQPVVEMLGLGSLVRALPGIEISPMVYGHFNAWPIEPDPTSPNGGAIDWPEGAGGYAMVPHEIFAAARDRGADMVQVNHPRQGAEGSSDITEHFDRMGLTFDYEERSIYGDPRSMPVPADWLRLPPDVPLFSLDFNALEVWNGSRPGDTNGDGYRELTALDVVMRDWFNFLSFGVPLTPLGNSDTHTIVEDPMGMPRTLVRVGDDSPAAIESGAVVDDVLQTLRGGDGTPVDIVVTNGPHISLRVNGVDKPIGALIAAPEGRIELAVEVLAPSWARPERLEVFANATPAIGDEITALSPVACFSVAGAALDPADPCATAAVKGVLERSRVDLGASFARWEARASISIDKADIPVRAGASGEDAWMVVRVSGQRPIYPMLTGGVVTDDNLAVLLEGGAAVEDAIAGRGVPATAFTAPIYIDFDGGGYRAPFAPAGAPSRQ